MFQEQLVKMINSGHCLALVGAGLSREIDYPDWKILAERAVEQLRIRKIAIDELSYSRYFESRKYPEVFSQVQRDLESREKLVELVSELLNFTPSSHGEAYKFITKWPFACYLTTNFDNEIQRHLRQRSVEFTVVGNSCESLSSLRHDTRDVIYKLHSDFELDGKPTITSADFQELYASGASSVYRDCLKAIFQKFDLLIIGYSLADPDMQYLLDLAREGATPEHPIFMVGPKEDFTDSQTAEFRERYNIRLLRYNNPDGRHRQLRRVLDTYDCFIQPRNTSAMPRSMTQEEVQESLDALSLYLHRKLSQIPANQAMAPLVLGELYKLAPNSASADDLAKGSLRRILTGAPDATKIVQESLDYLCNNSDATETNERFAISTDGSKKQQRVLFDSRSIKDRAFGYFRFSLSEHYANISDAEALAACTAFESAITTAFSNHSSAIVNAILSDDSTVAHEGIALFGDIRDAASAVLKGETFNAYMMASCDFIFRPKPDQKQYLASISQGYFLSHLLGRDPRYRRIQSKTLQEAAWLIDASILIPLIAQGSELSDFAQSLFTNLKELCVFVYTTEKFLLEIWEHYKWARDKVNRIDVQEKDTIYSCLMSDEYKPNLFLEGYASLVAQKEIESFEDYMKSCLQEEPSLPAFRKRLEDEFGIIIADPAIYITSAEEFDELKRKISQARIDRNIWRSTLQVEAEAEAYWAVMNYETVANSRQRADIQRSYFVSHSRVLNDVAERRVTWLPEGLFRYLSGIPGVTLDDNVMQQCILESISASVPVVDHRQFIGLFGKKIDIARLDFDREKESYIKNVETDQRAFEEAFESTPDIEKPLFVHQMGWRMARMEEQRRESAERARDSNIKELEAAKLQLKELEKEKDSGWKRRQEIIARQEAATNRNLQDPKHVRKRNRQAKERRRKKK